MTDLTLHLRIIGGILIALALAHVYISRHLGWRADAARMSPLNRQIFFVHAIFICMVVGMMGVLTLLYTDTLTTPTPLARVVLIGLLVFWGARLVFQWFVYDWSHWRGHRFNTAMHLFFTCLWTYFVLTFALTLRLQYAQP